ncbi:hypothetical protein CAOG_08259 [Capsaspora owczarzaki ATCC 30864]|uniref:CCHC-type domain-containing protein n=1 Tax=Capsaspora owczarzaki (strain ATCC 30864) TaxID=595528 RepID=A0A0D2WY25_CAPO3|nr:hypothetical protein CAOG_08259 [Capsaspora owczarzaki ATCC 30864]KJE98270.1 hypothetical protein CAOG_008259 [Capsaspora owczarzaki ATCC 30864]|eukprot:XP_004342428.1 hypothetical protein CAOG_08259 [Capsaspora owczarzaki ATCC 30864]
MPTRDGSRHLGLNGAQHSKQDIAAAVPPGPPPIGSGAKIWASVLHLVRKVVPLERSAPPAAVNSGTGSSPIPGAPPGASHAAAANGAAHTMQPPASSSISTSSSASSSSSSSSSSSLLTSHDIPAAVKKIRKSPRRTRYIDSLRFWVGCILWIGLSIFIATVDDYPSSDVRNLNPPAVLSLADALFTPKSDLPWLSQFVSGIASLPAFASSASPGPSLPPAAAPSGSANHNHHSHHSHPHHHHHHHQGNPATPPSPASGSLDANSVPAQLPFATSSTASSAISSFLGSLPIELVATRGPWSSLQCRSVTTSTNSQAASPKKLPVLYCGSRVWMADAVMLGSQLAQVGSALQLSSTAPTPSPVAPHQHLRVPRSATRQNPFAPYSYEDAHALFGTAHQAAHHFAAHEELLQSTFLNIYQRVSEYRTLGDSASLFSHDSQSAPSSSASASPSNPDNADAAPSETQKQLRMFQQECQLPPAPAGIDRQCTVFAYPRIAHWYEHLSHELSLALADGSVNEAIANAKQKVLAQLYNHPNSELCIVVLRLNNMVYTGTLVAAIDQSHSILRMAQQAAARVEQRFVEKMPQDTVSDVVLGVARLAKHSVQRLCIFAVSTAIRTVSTLGSLVVSLATEIGGRAMSDDAAYDYDDESELFVEDGEQELVPAAGDVHQPARTDCSSSAVDEASAQIRCSDVMPLQPSPPHPPRQLSDEGIAQLEVQLSRMLDILSIPSESPVAPEKAARITQLRDCVMSLRVVLESIRRGRIAQREATDHFQLILSLAAQFGASIPTESLGVAKTTGSAQDRIEDAAAAAAQQTTADASQQTQPASSATQPARPKRQSGKRRAASSQLDPLDDVSGTKESVFLTLMACLALFATVRRISNRLFRDPHAPTSATATATAAAVSSGSEQADDVDAAQTATDTSTSAKDSAVDARLVPPRQQTKQQQQKQQQMRQRSHKTEDDSPLPQVSASTASTTTIFEEVVPAPGVPAVGMAQQSTSQSLSLASNGEMHAAVKSVTLVTTATTTTILDASSSDDTVMAAEPGGGSESAPHSARSSLSEGTGSQRTSISADSAFTLMPPPSPRSTKSSRRRKPSATPSIDASAQGSPAPSIPPSPRAFFEGNSFDAWPPASNNGSTVGKHRSSASASSNGTSNGHSRSARRSSQQHSSASLSHHHPHHAPAAHSQNGGLSNPGAYFDPQQHLFQQQQYQLQRQQLLQQQQQQFPSALGQSSSFARQPQAQQSQQQQHTALASRSVPNLPGDASFTAQFEAWQNYLLQVAQMDPAALYGLLHTSAAANAISSTQSAAAVVSAKQAAQPNGNGSTRASTPSSGGASASGTPTVYPAVSPAATGAAPVGSLSAASSVENLAAPSTTSDTSTPSALASETDPLASVVSLLQQQQKWFSSQPNVAVPVSLPAASETPDALLSAEAPAPSVHPTHAVTVPLQTRRTRSCASSSSSLLPAVATSLAVSAAFAQSDSVLGGVSPPLSPSMSSALSMSSSSDSSTTSMGSSLSSMSSATTSTSPTTPPESSTLATKVQTWNSTIVRGVYCCNCGYEGHTIRDCREPTLDETMRQQAQPPVRSANNNGLSATGPAPSMNLQEAARLVLAHASYLEQMNKIVQLQNKLIPPPGGHAGGTDVRAAQQQQQQQLPQMPPRVPLAAPFPLPPIAIDPHLLQQQLLLHVQQQALLGGGGGAGGPPAGVFPNPPPSHAVSAPNMPMLAPSLVAAATAALSPSPALQQQQELIRLQFGGMQPPIPFARQPPRAPSSLPNAQSAQL